MKTRATRLLTGVVLLSFSQLAASAAWVRHTIDDISEGADGVRLANINGDGDLDVITCEEAHNLGVIWYENPTR